ncbi:MAG: helix-turn-helix domain-containing protein [Proteobacteria bacterium]|nr:helix-turn-helix domain-containing protein [Pseudomonadota bacterium]MBU1739770.1 helix-turn-helix domain-containing protein [Pseudomonadota bacterium]
MSHFSPSETTREFVRQVGRNLRLARKRRRKTIEEVAGMVGVSAATIKRVEAGESAVKFGIYLAIAEVFQLTDTIRFAEPGSDAIGMTMEKQRMPQRIRKKKDSRLDF